MSYHNNNYGYGSNGYNQNQNNQYNNRNQSQNYHNNNYQQGNQMYNDNRHHPYMTDAIEEEPEEGYEMQHVDVADAHHAQNLEQRHDNNHQNIPVPVPVDHGYEGVSTMTSDPIYSSFINTNSRNRPAPPQQYYNNVFVNNHMRHESDGQSELETPTTMAPSINVIQHTPELIHGNTSNSILASYSSTNNLHYFNEDDYYYNNIIRTEDDINNSDKGPHLGLPANSATHLVSDEPSIISNSEDTRPILTAPVDESYGHHNISNQEQNQNNYHAYEYNSPQYDQNQSHHPYYNNTGQLAGDVENTWVDPNGDDYQINSYLGRNGEMIDPYEVDDSQVGYQRSNNLLSVDYPRNKKIESSTTNKEIMDEGYGYGDEDEGDLSSGSIISGYEHGDLADGDTNTIDKLRSSNTSYSSVGSRDMLISQDDGSRRNIPKRAGTQVRKFKLWRGNFVFDSPISKTLLNQYQGTIDKTNTLSNEFKFMRYQAVTCEPNMMAQENFTVRQLRYLTPRTTELLIVITMYNEDHILLGRTLKGVMDNIKHMVKKTRSSTWGPDAWKKIVVCIVSDGRAKINEKSLALLSSLGCYQDGFAKDEINDKKVVTHVYEHTTMMNVTDVTDDHVELSCNQSTVPIQMLFCLKEQNQKKINSHRWAFEGFAELLQPNIVTLLDAGTMPGKDSIYELWREFRNPHVGGACGEIRTDLGKKFSNLINPLVASQNFEYKMSNILDKTTESNFGFITVLPGAFSAYRLEAVRGLPLQKYFYGESMEHEEKFHFFSSNMYLAEDRILCFEVVMKKDASWILKYCRSSYATTDVPERVPEFILQRRRWLNGSFFASVYSFFHFYRIWTSGHNIFRKMFLMIEFVYLFFNTLLSWFSLSSYFLVFRILTLSIALTYKSAFGWLSVVFLWLYGVCVLSTFILSLGNKPKSTELYYVVTFIFFAVLMIYMMFCSIYMSVKSFQDLLKEDHITFSGLITQETFRDMVISLGSTVCLYLLSSIIYLQPWHMFTSFAQYLLLSPSYVNVLNIYAFCNVHDLSWGTKGTASKPLGKINSKEDGTFKMEILVSSSEIQANYEKYKKLLNETPTEEDSKPTLDYEEKKTGYYANVRSLVIIVWVMTNFAICAVVLETGGIGEYLIMKQENKNHTDIAPPRPLLSNKASVYFAVILWLVALSAVIRFFGCCIYMVSRFFKRLRHW
ncbi:chitin synthase CHS1 [Nakaseomyces bracarensis]|uniref:chitin synthase CHS1 n=1 Tax=Nakaseomyces bracarensis TaxID=273131 RepID=UPI0038724D7A